VRRRLIFWFCLAIQAILLYAIWTRIGGSKVRAKISGPSDTAGITTALRSYEVDNGIYPKSLQDLLQKPSGTTNWHGPYLEKNPQDPWGKNYIYECPGKHNPSSYDLMSLGLDGKAGTEDDIGNWTTK
jgi:Bacterial type II secretion system protein G.